MSLWLSRNFLALARGGVQQTEMFLLFFLWCRRIEEKQHFLVETHLDIKLKPKRALKAVKPSSQDFIGLRRSRGRPRKTPIAN